MSHLKRRLTGTLLYTLVCLVVIYDVLQHFYFMRLWVRNSLVEPLLALLIDPLLEILIMHPNPTVDAL